MKERDRQVVISCLRKMVLPLMRFSLKMSLTIQDIIESVKVCVLEIAAREIESLGEEPKTIQEERAPDKSETSESCSA